MDFGKLSNKQRSLIREIATQPINPDVARSYHARTINSLIQRGLIMWVGEPGIDHLGFTAYGEWAIITKNVLNFPRGVLFLYEQAFTLYPDDSADDTDSVTADDTDSVTADDVVDGTGDSFWADDSIENVARVSSLSIVGGVDDHLHATRVYAARVAKWSANLEHWREKRRECSPYITARQQVTADKMYETCLSSLERNAHYMNNSLERVGR